MSKEICIGFVGFGEAGFHLAKGLRSGCAAQICAYDIQAKSLEKIQLRAAEAEIELVDSNQLLAEKCDVILSTVTANKAMEAAQQNAPYLNEKHLYADLNSISPKLKQSIGALIDGRGARFVEIAIMSPVPPHGHQVPMFLGGKSAPEFVNLLSPLGMNLEIISEEIGAASATKMCRSIIVKGMEALLLECVLGAVPYGVDERVFATLEETMPGMNWKKMASYMVGRVIEHGERRARELEEVAVTLREIGVDPMMTEAIVKRQDWGARLNLLAEFGGKPPEDYRAVVNAIVERKREVSE